MSADTIHAPHFPAVPHPRSVLAMVDEYEAAKADGDGHPAYIEAQLVTAIRVHGVVSHRGRVYRANGAGELVILASDRAPKRKPKPPWRLYEDGPAPKGAALKGEAAHNLRTVKADKNRRWTPN